MKECQHQAADFLAPLQPNPIAPGPCRKRTATPVCVLDNADGSWSRNGSTDSFARTESIAEYPALVEAMHALDGEAVRSVLDAGANDGYSTLLFRRGLPRAKVIVGVEPGLSNYAMVLLNTRGVSGIVPVRAALWGETGSLEVLPNQWGEWSLRVGMHASNKYPVEGTVPSLTVSALAHAVCVRSFDFIKLDIEGAESDVLAREESFAPWLCKARYLYMEVHPATHDWRRNRTVTALRGSLNALYTCKMTVFTFPTMRNPVLRHLREYIFFACGADVSSAKCSEVCHRWRKGSPHRCQPVAGRDDYFGKGLRAPLTASG